MQKQISNLDKLTLSNDFLFKHVMLRKRICKHILEELFHTKIADITYLEAEQTLDVYPDSPCLTTSTVIQLPVISRAMSPIRLRKSRMIRK